MAPRSLDVSALRRGGGPRTRMHVLRTNPQLVVAATITAALILVSAIALVAVPLAEGPADPGLLAFLCMLLLMGLALLVSVVRRTGSTGGLAVFAQVNDLDFQQSVQARDYASARFRSGSWIVQQSVRTREERFVEIGDAWPMSPDMPVRAQRRSELFVRIRLSRPVREEARADPRTGFVTPEVDEALRGFAGAYVLEAEGAELTLWGRRPLDPSRPERVEEAFFLADALAARAEELLVDRSAPPATPWGTSLLNEADARSPRRGASALRVVAVVLGLLILLPVGIALVMSVLDDHLRGNATAARIVVAVIVLIVGQIVVRAIRRLTARRR
ncbi:hypothetical protein [Brachybacterium hainanense]|uniref:DUF3137 domain-containing protein n=1 Tax=Brachybacterium hainanense TaxID=1541174 RepID=A0ABV6RDZ7_9MICO